MVYPRRYSFIFFRLEDISELSIFLLFVTLISAVLIEDTVGVCGEFDEIVLKLFIDSGEAALESSGSSDENAVLALVVSVEEFDKIGGSSGGIGTFWMLVVFVEIALEPFSGFDAIFVKILADFDKLFLGLLLFAEVSEAPGRFCVFFAKTVFSVLELLLLRDVSETPGCCGANFVNTIVAATGLLFCVVVFLETSGRFDVIFIDCRSSCSFSKVDFTRRFQLRKWKAFTVAGSRDLLFSPRMSLYEENDLSTSHDVMVAVQYV